jgi:hypothetical protein
MNQASKLFLSVMAGFFWSCQSEQSISPTLDSTDIKLAIRMDRIERNQVKIIRWQDSMSEQYNADYYVNQKLQDTLFVMANGKRANLKWWYRLGQNLRTGYEGWKEFKSAVPML